MGNFLQIPGETPLPYPRPTRPRSGAPGFFALLFLALLCAGGYVLVRYWPSFFPPSNKNDAPLPAVAKPASATIPTADAEDLLHHLESAESDAQAASEGMRRSGEWLARVRPGLDQNYLAVEKRRLDAANAVLESARRSVAKAREELETTKNLLRERSVSNP